MIALIGFPCERVVRASRVLTAGEKLLWSEIRAFEKFEDGCYLTAAQLGERLGMTSETVEQYRRRLQRGGLLRAKAAGEGRRSRWWPALPTESRPTSQRPSPSELRACAEALDRRLASVPQSVPRYGGQSEAGHGLNALTDGADREGGDKEGGATPHSPLPSGVKSKARSSPLPPSPEHGAALHAGREAGATALPGGNGWAAVAQVLADFDPRAKAWLAQHPPADGGAVPGTDGNRGDESPACPTHGPDLMTWTQEGDKCGVCARLALVGAGPDYGADHEHGADRDHRRGPDHGAPPS